MLASLLMVVLLAYAPAETASPAWFERYELALRLLEDGKAGEAGAELRAALALRPQEGLQIPTRPMQYIDYLPHLHLAITAQMLGEVETARRHLQAAERSGVAEKSEVGRALLIAYQQLLRGELSQQYQRPRFAVFPQRPTVLTDEEFDSLRGEVLARCAIPPTSKLAQVPWYAHYELGLEVARRGDPQRALNLFLDAVGRRPNPQRRARMYGMWLIDYYPYFNIARSHMKLGNWECARDALEVSGKLREIPPAAPEYGEFLGMQREAEKHQPEP
jgi:tetratricopeptide (TPR) repeat protein